MPHSIQHVREYVYDPAQAPLPRWMRLALVLLAGALVGVLGLALVIRPYDETGQPLRMGTHRQLGLPPCNFLVQTGRPCPSCGLTTSFALLAHGDWQGSLRANWVGTLMASLTLLAIPWSLVSSLRGRYLWIRSLDRALTILVGVVLLLLLVRWGIVLATTSLAV